MSAEQLYSRGQNALRSWVASGGLDPSLLVREISDGPNRTRTRVHFLNDGGLSIFSSLYLYREGEVMVPYIWLEAAVSIAPPEKAAEIHRQLLAKNQEIIHPVRLAISEDIILLVHRSSLTDRNFESFKEMLSEFIGMAQLTQENLESEFGLLPYVEAARLLDATIQRH